MVKGFCWGLPQIIATTRNSLDVAFVSEDERQSLLGQFEREWAAFV